MDKTPFFRNSIFVDFYLKYLTSGSRQHFVVNPFIFCMHKVDNALFYEAVIAVVSDLFPGHLLRQNIEVEASFGFIDKGISSYQKPEDFNFENRTTGLLVVRVYDKVCTLTVSAHYNQINERSVTVSDHSGGSSFSSRPICVDFHNPEENNKGLKHLALSIGKAFLAYN